MSSSSPSPTASVVIPAYNEESTIPRLLAGLDARRRAGDLEVVVVPNGCHDDTAGVARAAGVQVVELADGGKPGALNAGDAAATVFPRFYVDADIVMTGDDIVRLAAAMDDDVIAAAPSRRFSTDGASVAVRSYLRIWDQLPSVAESLAGRGCYGVTEQGRRRWETFPDVIADDAFVNTRFAPHERANPADVVSTVDAPKNLRALLNRKRRGHRGNRELEHQGAAITSSSAWLGVVRRDPRRVVDVPAYLVVTVLTRILAKLDERRGTTEWTTDR